MCPRKRSKQLISGPYHKVLSDCLATATSHRGLASKNWCRRRRGDVSQGKRQEPRRRVKWSEMLLQSRRLRELCAIVTHNCAIFIQAMRDCGQQEFTSGRDANKLRSLYLPARLWRYCESKAKRIIRHARKKWGNHWFSDEYLQSILKRCVHFEISRRNWTNITIS